MSDKGKTAKLTHGSNVMIVNDSKITLEAPVKVIGGRTMIPLRAFTENVIDKKVFIDRGLIIISDSVFLNAETDKIMVDQIIGKIFDPQAIKPVIYPIPTPLAVPIPISKCIELFVDKFDNKLSMDQFIDKRFLAIDGTNAYGYFAKDKGRLRRTDNVYELPSGSPYAFGTYKTERDITGFSSTVFYTAPVYKTDYDLIFSVSSDNINFEKIKVKKSTIADTKSIHPGAYLIFSTENESPIPAGNKYLRIEWYNSFGKPDREPRWSPQIGDIEIYLDKNSKK